MAMTIALDSNIKVSQTRSWRAGAKKAKAWQSRPAHPVGKMGAMLETRPSLIARVCQNDPASWSEFVELYRPCLLKYARQKGATEDQAEDVAQQVLIKLMRALPKFEYDPAQGKFRNYLYRATLNGFVQWWRQNRRHTQRHTPWETWVTGVADNAPDEADEQWVQLVRREAVQKALATVKAQTRPETWECFEFHILNRRPAAEVAEQLGKKAGAVYTAACRVLQRVRELCQQYMEPLDDAA